MVEHLENAYVSQSFFLRQGLICPVSLRDGILNRKGGSMLGDPITASEMNIACVSLAA